MITTNNKSHYDNGDDDDDDNKVMLVCLGQSVSVDIEVATSSLLMMNLCIFMCGFVGGF